MFSQKLGSLSSPGDFHLYDFFSENSTSFNSMSSHSFCLVSFVLSSSLLIYSASSMCSFSLLHIFFAKIFNFLYRRRLFDFNGLFSHLPVELLRISLKYFILLLEFRPFFKSSNSLCLDQYFLFYSFAVVISFSFCNLYFLLTFRPFLVFRLISFDKSSSIDSSPLKASTSF